MIWNQIWKRIFSDVSNRGHCWKNSVNCKKNLKNQCISGFISKTIFLSQVMQRTFLIQLKKILKSYLVMFYKTLKNHNIFKKKGNAIKPYLLLMGFWIKKNTFCSSVCFNEHCFILIYFNKVYNFAEDTKSGVTNIWPILDDYVKCP